MNKSGRARHMAGFILSCCLLIVIACALLAQYNRHPSGSEPLAGHNAGAGSGSGLSPDKPYKIMIDPGHGGKDPGSEGSDGAWEKDINLALAQKLYDLLKQDPAFEPRLTRADDTFVELADRAAMANDWHADVLVSIHGNAFEDKSVAGTETYYRYANGHPLATIIHNQLLGALDFQDRGVKEESLKVLSLSAMPAILIEPGYVTNPAEEAVMQSDDGQSRAAQAIADGLKQYFAER
ncbi:N-acetylmuramoyl-L-alanine amidase [Paenibacillus rhizovicinus]|uniref:N-acetylmuramoyl-L-alanine amidase n=1 Tax=Paenibacillus rhizovicinus TaxID=2704463 RepID=A0A6C0NTS8_9BACL|nr:N-acetylmuramoyl-L-alanine amidase [Paenibacillus rhizovicinus]QHW29558.1 N-acetylmuramoyl-L-alanine amidase [Paenibacillus rhizovicinus]